jgi:hypothetical protein
MTRLSAAMHTEVRQAQHGTSLPISVQGNE